MCEWYVSYTYAYTLFRYCFNVVLESNILCLPSFVYCSTGLVSVLFFTRNSAWVESLVEWSYDGLSYPFFSSPTPRHATDYSLPHSRSRVHTLMCIFYVNGLLFPPRSTIPVMSLGLYLFTSTPSFWYIPSSRMLCFFPVPLWSFIILLFSHSLFTGSRMLLLTSFQTSLMFVHR